MVLIDQSETECFCFSMSEKVTILTNVFLKSLRYSLNDGVGGLSRDLGFRSLDFVFRRGQSSICRSHCFTRCVNINIGNEAGLLGEELNCRIAINGNGSA